MATEIHRELVTPRGSECAYAPSTSMLLMRPLNAGNYGCNDKAISVYTNMDTEDIPWFGKLLWKLPCQVRDLMVLAHCPES